MNQDIFYESAKEVPQELKEIIIKYFKANKIKTFRIGLEIVWIHVIEEIMEVENGFNGIPNDNVSSSYT